jgi:hypothetical protein
LDLFARPLAAQLQENPKDDPSPCALLGVALARESGGEDDVALVAFETKPGHCRIDEVFLRDVSVNDSGLLDVIAEARWGRGS